MTEEGNGTSILAKIADMFNDLRVENNKTASKIIHSIDELSNRVLLMDNRLKNVEIAVQKMAEKPPTRRPAVVFGNE